MEDESPRTQPGPEGSLFLGALSHEVIGAFFEVYNALRFGMLESAYAGAMHFELLQRGIRCEREVLLHVRYKGQIVGAYRADLVVDGRVILELKCLPEVGHREKRQLLHYLRATDLQLGLLLNFGPEPKFLRVINTPDGRPDPR